MYRGFHFRKQRSTRENWNQSAKNVKDAPNETFGSQQGAPTESLADTESNVLDTSAQYQSIVTSSQEPMTPQSKHGPDKATSSQESTTLQSMDVTQGEEVTADNKNHSIPSQEAARQSVVQRDDISGQLVTHKDVAAEQSVAHKVNISGQFVVQKKDIPGQSNAQKEDIPGQSGTSFPNHEGSCFDEQPREKSEKDDISRDSAVQIGNIPEQSVVQKDYTPSQSGTSFPNLEGSCIDEQPREKSEKDEEKGIKSSYGNIWH
jgi:hypothetical protein